MGLRCLDLACSDGWVLANLAQMEGVNLDVVDGVDLNPKACERARERLRDLPGRIVCDDIHRAAEHFEAGTYDVVVAFEVIEHVPDAGRLIGVMAEMAKPGGRCYVSTPEGAFERGHLPDWQRVEHKGHLRALRPSDLMDLVCERGIVQAHDVGQRVQVTCFEPSPRRGKVIFYAGAAEALPEKIVTEGLGGSETALCKLAEHLARRGYDVRVYTGAEHGGVRSDQISVEGIDEPSGQVLYRPSAAWDPGERCDLFISSRIPEVFDRTIAAPRRALWLHDADYGERLSPERVARATDVLVMSEFQRGLLMARYPHIAEKVRVTRNGIETRFFKRLPKSRKPWVVYSSSPDRGLDVLLECWPAIRESVPDAELHATYAPVYHQFRQQYPHLQAFHAQLEQLAKADGVVWHEAMNQRELARLYARSRCWAYPSWTTPLVSAPFPEISCISAMEAQAAGAVPVCLDHGALKETVVTGERIPVAKYNGRLRDSWRTAFVNAIICALTDDAWRAECGRKGRRWALRQDWSGVADQWENWFLSSSETKARIAA